MFRAFAVSLMAVALAAPCFAQLPKLTPKQKSKAIDQEQRQLDRLSKMSPEDRKRALNRFPPQRRAVLEQRLERYERLTPEQRQRLNQQVDQFQQMPEERRVAVRQLYEKFERFDARRKPLLRMELQRLRKMEAAQRDFRMGNRRFQLLFTEAERDWLHAMVDALEN
jgi:hypothetical protein